MINVTVWNEGVHEKTSNEVAGVYPAGIHGCIKNFLSTQEDIEIRTATLAQRRCGLSDEVLENTDVLIWWGHMAHHEVNDAIVEKVRDRVYMGMGLIVMHSGHYSKVFQRVVGTTGNLLWGSNVKEIIWNINPTHPIAQGIPAHFSIDREEMYGEQFDIPKPDDVVFMGWFNGGEVFRSGVTFTRGLGKIFYFQPGHETYPTYYNEEIIKVIKNGINWVYSTYRDTKGLDSHHVKIPTTVSEDK